MYKSAEMEYLKHKTELNFMRLINYKNIVKEDNQKMKNVLHSLKMKFALNPLKIYHALSTEYFC